MDKQRQRQRNQKAQLLIRLANLQPRRKRHKPGKLSNPSNPPSKRRNFNEISQAKKAQIKGTNPAKHNETHQAESRANNNISRVKPRQKAD
jgi:hypothetical protein